MRHEVRGMKLEVSNSYLALRISFITPLASPRQYYGEGASASVTLAPTKTTSVTLSNVVVCILSDFGQALQGLTDKISVPYNLNL